jgi:hypothetical protein
MARILMLCYVGIPFAVIIIINIKANIRTVSICLEELEK